MIVSDNSSKETAYSIKQMPLTTKMSPELLSCAMGKRGCRFCTELHFQLSTRVELIGNNCDRI